MLITKRRRWSHEAHHRPCNDSPKAKATFANGDAVPMTKDDGTAVRGREVKKWGLVASSVFFSTGTIRWLSSQQAPRQSHKKALLIGISRVNETTSFDKLRGPPRDVRAMRSLLIEQYNFPKENVRILLDTAGTPPDDKPTYDNIVREISNLSNNSQPGDEFVFHFAGHSEQTPNFDGTEEDNMDEVIRTTDNKSIYDDELKKRLVDPLVPGSSLVAILDTCHSQSLLDLPHFRCNRVSKRLTSGSRRILRHGLETLSNMSEIFSSPPSTPQVPPATPNTSPGTSPPGTFGTGGHSRQSSYFGSFGRHGKSRSVPDATRTDGLDDNPRHLLRKHGHARGASHPLPPQPILSSPPPPRNASLRKKRQQREGTMNTVSDILVDPPSLTTPPSTLKKKSRDGGGLSPIPPTPIVEGGQQEQIPSPPTDFRPCSSSGAEPKRRQTTLTTGTDDSQQQSQFLSPPVTSASSDGKVIRREPSSISSLASVSASAMSREASSSTGHLDVPPSPSPSPQVHRHPIPYYTESPDPNLAADLNAHEVDPAGRLVRRSSTLDKMMGIGTVKYGMNRFCRGFCHRAMGTGTARPYVLCISACKDGQKTIDDCTMTGALIELLRENARPTLKELMRGVSTRLQSDIKSMYDAQYTQYSASYREYVSNSRKNGMLKVLKKVPPPEKNLRKRMQDPQMSSLSPLFMSDHLSL